MFSGWCRVLCCHPVAILPSQWFWPASRRRLRARPGSRSQHTGARFTGLVRRMPAGYEDAARRRCTRTDPCISSRTSGERGFRAAGEKRSRGCGRSECAARVRTAPQRVRGANACGTSAHWRPAARTPEGAPARDRLGARCGGRSSRRRVAREARAHGGGADARSYDSWDPRQRGHVVVGAHPAPACVGRALAAWRA
jgi:hypothetical protein